MVFITFIFWGITGWVWGKQKKKNALYDIKHGPYKPLKYVLLPVSFFVLLFFCFGAIPMVLFGNYQRQGIMYGSLFGMGLYPLSLVLVIPPIRRLGCKLIDLDPEQADVSKM
jgi:hypothetical protein